MTMDHFRKNERESAEPIGRLGFQLLLASASARQASSRTARAVVLNAVAAETGSEPDQYRIQILASRAHPSHGQQPGLGRFSDVNLPRPREGDCSAATDDNPSGTATT